MIFYVILCNFAFWLIEIEFSSVQSSLVWMSDTRFLLIFESWKAKNNSFPSPKQHKVLLCELRHPIQNHHWFTIHHPSIRHHRPRTCPGHVLSTGSMKSKGPKTRHTISSWLGLQLKMSVTNETRNDHDIATDSEEHWDIHDNQQSGW